MKSLLTRPVCCLLLPALTLIISPAALAESDPISATIHSVSSNIAGFDRSADHLIDGSGLDPISGTHSTDPDGTMWLNQGTFFTGPPELEPEITFDLGDVFAVDRMQIWNYNETHPSSPVLNRRGIARMDVFISTDGVDFQLLIEGQLLDIAPGSSTVDFSETVDLGGISTRYIKFDNISTHGGDQNLVGLSEVQFFAVPEPSSVVLAILGLFGLLFRRVRSGV